MANNEVVIRFRGDGGNLDETLKRLAEELGKLGNTNAPKKLKDTSDAIAALAQSMGKTYGEARKFAQELGISAEKATNVIGRLRELDAASASNTQKFRALSKELGLTREQFEKLNASAGQKKLDVDLTLGLETVGAKALEVSGALLGVGNTAEAAFGALQDAQAKVSTIAPDVNAMTASARRLSDELNNQVTTTEIVNASYDVYSSGATNAAEASSILKASALGAIGGFSSLNTVADATTTVLNAYGLEFSKAGDLVDKFAATQNAGKITIDQYAQQIGIVASSAALAGVSLDELNGLIATATIKGVQASPAITGIRQAISAIVKPSDDAQAILNQVGIASGAAALKAGGLTGVLQRLDAAGLGGSDTLFKLFGSVEAVTAIAPSAGAGLALLQKNIDLSANSAGSAQAAFEKVSKGATRSQEAINNQVNEALTALGAGTDKIIAPIAAGTLLLFKNFNQLPTPVKDSLGVILLFGGALFSVVATLTAFNLLNVAGAAAMAAKSVATVAATVATGIYDGTMKAAAASSFLFTTQIKLAQIQLIAMTAYQGAAAIAQAAYSKATALAATVTAILKTELTIAGVRAAAAATGTTIMTAATSGLGAATAFATTTLTAYKFALLSVAAPLAALAAGLAITEVVRFTGQLKEQQEAIDNLGVTTDEALQLGLKSQGAVKRALDAQNDAKRTGVKLTQEQLAAEQKALENAQKALTLLKQRLAEAEKTPEAKAGFGGFGQAEADAQNNARKRNLDALKNQIDALDRQAKLLGATSPAAIGKPTPIVDPKAARDDEKRKRDQAFEDAKQKKDQTFQDAKERREQAFQDAKALREQKQQDDRAAREEQRADAKAARDEQRQLAAQGRQEAFDQRRQTAEDAFRQSQEAKSEAFNKKQQADQEAFTLRQSEAKRKFDEQISAEQRAIERRQQLRDADPKERANLQRQFRQSDRNAAELAPLEAKRREFERRQADEAKAQAEKQKAEQKAEEDRKKTEELAFKAQQKEEEKAFKLEERAIEKAQKEEDRAIAKAQKEEDRQIDRAFKEEEKARDRAFKEEEKSLERAFKSEQQAAERAFKEQQRQFDLETTRQQKAILESTQIPAPAPTPQAGTTPPATPGRSAPVGRFLGGPISAGESYQVGERGSERFVSATDGYILNHQDSMRLARESLSSRAPISAGSFTDGLEVRSPIPAGVFNPAGNTTDPLLTELRSLRKVVENREQKISVPVKFDGPVTEQNFDKYLRLQRSIIRGGL